MQKTIKKFLNKLVTLLIALILFSCKSPMNKDVTIEEKLPISTGIWKMELDLNGESLPFNFTFQELRPGYLMTIINAEERIKTDEIKIIDDSIFIKLPVFDSEFELTIVDSNHLSGYWINHYKGEAKKINVKASFGESNRFSGTVEQFMQDISGKYEVTFSPNSEKASKAIGLFKQTNNEIQGTFATETGDYRHLHGEFVKDSLFLSTFDGSHAYLFKAKLIGNQLIGHFWSGLSPKVPWEATINNSFELRSPDSLTFLKEGYGKLNLELSNLENQLIRLTDERYKNKVIIVQIMGSWCPNCLDETHYLSDLYNQYQPKGLEVIAVAFERSRTKDKAIENVKRLQSKVGAKYEFLMGGYTFEDKAINTFPMLNHIMSYPTALFIDKKGVIRKIHTGFYGPGTGIYFENFKKETALYVDSLLKE
ncbi:MAG: TlpA family protein disulfide reductase [Bacteroidetes bacterium]|nr:MAG: TlpA family protein disulfide reductase [Bacteroidota bacterium]MBL1143730.1 TlpA family protein disulfide reductase [Bacteroidota bacterium]NOG56532.1 TlpA family protein disulfide reductase [Bacteroidota bacterium]